MSFHTASRIGLSLLFVSLTSCRPSSPPLSKAQPSAPQGTTSVPSDPRPIPLESLHEGPPISHDEAIEFGRQIEAIVSSGEVDAFRSLFDWPSFQKVVVSKLPAYESYPDLQAGLMSGVENGIAALPANLMAPIAGARYTLLGPRRRPEGTRVLFRLLSPEGLLNYHEYCLIRRSGVIRAVDLYAINTGERFTDGISQSLTQVMPPSALGYEAIVEEAKKRKALMEEMLSAFQAGENQRVLDLYLALPQSVQHQKSVQLMRLAASHRVGEKANLDAIDNYRQLFPDDPTLDFASLPALAARKQWEEFHAAIDRIDQAINGDPYLKVVHGENYLAEGNKEAAIRCAQEALVEDPKLEQAIWLLVTISLQNKDHAQTAALLTKIQKELGIELSDLREHPDYAEFIKSPEYDTWSKLHQNVTSPCP